MSTALRIQFIIMGLFVYLGIYLSGSANVHWFLYVPVAAMIFAGITGFCPGLRVLKAMGLN